MKNKVLLIGPNFFNYNKSIAAAFDPALFTVKIINYHEQYGKIDLYSKIKYFFSRTRDQTSSKLFKRLNRYLVGVYESFQPDIVLIIKGNHIMEETVLSMNRSKNLLWMLDSIFLNAQSLKLADKLDALFFFEQTDVEQIKFLNKQAYFLPAAFDDRIFKDLSLKKDIDILFIGTLYEERVRLLDRLKEKFPQLNIKVYCWRYRIYKTPIKYFMSFWDRLYINRFVTLKQANKLYNRSKICLNMHHGQSIYGVNPRFFEISGANAVQFVEDKPFINDYFPNYNIPVYKTEDELFSMIALYFSKNSPAQDFRALYNDLHANHTYKNRVNTILSKINA